ncbi:MAG: 30S ribosomal protein S8 [Candidatus Omnitrophica bacterium]|nr:30S ribosomal protein S8 [Candidatus Omnitrophota bacterium]MDD5429148.1 30S ribosomal protein S8 [Candidatus Omnitrophota bacterium]
MSRTDLISDVFTIIRNASRAKMEDTYIPHSKIVNRICEILKDEGYIENCKEVDLQGQKKIRIYLKYDGRKSVISQIQKVSTPGKRVYVKRGSVPAVLRGHGIAIISTSAGVFTDKQAREKGVGGELIGKIW